MRLAPLAIGLALGCAANDSPAPPGPGDPETTEMRGFSWVIDQKLAGMPRPRPEDLAYLEEQGIDVLFSLTEVSTDAALAASHGIELIHIPVKDFTAPTTDQLATFVDTARARMADGKRVGVHCGAGLGRTGTFLSAWFTADGMGPEAAINHVRTLRPGSVETEDQERAVVRFYQTVVAPVKDPGRSGDRK